MTDLDYGAFDALTFDCYGTLIDWEAGILPRLPAAASGARDPATTRRCSTSTRTPRRRSRPARTAATARSPARRWPRSRGHTASSRAPTRSRAFGGSVVDWPAFPDSHDALVRLKTRFRLGVLTNCDDDLFAASNARLGVEFDWIVTAQQVGSYKPDERNFAALTERLAADGVARARILHVAQSLFHDHAPAQRLGFRSVWIDRRHDRPAAARRRRGRAPGRDVPVDGRVRSRGRAI